MKGFKWKSRSDQLVDIEVAGSYNVHLFFFLFFFFFNRSIIREAEILSFPLDKHTRVHSNKRFLGKQSVSSTFKKSEKEKNFKFLSLHENFLLSLCIQFT